VLALSRVLSVSCTVLLSHGLVVKERYRCGGVVLTLRHVLTCQDDVEAERGNLEAAKAKMQAFDSDYAAYNGLVTEAESLSGRPQTKARRRTSVAEPGENPYSLYSHAEIAGLHNEVMNLIPQRESKLNEESARQASREAMRKQWAEAAEAVVQWETGVSSRLQAFTNAGHESTLEVQVEQLKGIQNEIEECVLDTIPYPASVPTRASRWHARSALTQRARAHAHTHTHTRTHTHTHIPTTLSHRTSPTLQVLHVDVSVT
jgi:hypothetical protein